MQFELFHIIICTEYQENLHLYISSTCMSIPLCVDLLLQKPESPLLPALTRGGSLGRSKLQIFFFLFQSRDADTRFQQVLTGFCDFYSDEGVNMRPCIMQLGITVTTATHQSSVRAHHTLYACSISTGSRMTGRSLHPHQPFLDSLS